MRIVDERDFGVFLAERRRRSSPPGLVESVAAIVEEVRVGGDAALLNCMRRFDGVNLAGSRLEVTASEFEDAYEAMDDDTLQAIRLAVRRVTEYHKEVLADGDRLYASPEGFLGRVYRPVGRAGLYIPGGLRPYISTVVMTAVPARVAGVGTIVACTPPRRDGSVDPGLIVACREAGVSRLFRAGGAQAIAAMAYGTESIPRVDKIAGPGNRYVTAAKRIVFGDVGIDSLAGPSEVAIVADESADASLVALDLLAQAEHGADSLAVLLTPSPDLLRSVEKLVDRAEPGAGEIAGVMARDLAQAMELANILAPEHLQVVAEDPLRLLTLVRTAGAVLLGEYSPAALGDYVAGPSHVLPTGGASRFSSGLTADDFLVSTSVIYAFPGGCAVLAEAAALLADAEGFPHHARALRARAIRRGG